MSVNSKNGLKGDPSITKADLSKDILEGIIQSATDAIIVIDQSHRIILFNRSAERIFGWQAHEVLGKDLDLILAPELRGRHKKFIEQFLQTGRSPVLGQVLSGTGYRRNGQRFPLRISRSASRCKDSWIFTAILRDITKRKEMERQLVESQKLAAVGMAVSRIVHDIKNPLIAIGGLVSNLYRKEEDPRKKEKLALILREVERLQKLLQDINQFGRTLKLDLKEIDLRELCQEALKIYQARFKEKGIHVRFKAPDYPLKLHLDEMRFKEVLFNLMQNALEAMPQGGELELEIRPQEKEVYIFIRDTGPGLSEEVLKHLFTPFFTTKKKGTGLGLSISRRIVEAHGGEIKGRNYQKGAEFVIILPLTR